MSAPSLPPSASDGARGLSASVPPMATALNSPPTFTTRATPPPAPGPSSSYASLRPRHSSTGSTRTTWFARQGYLASCKMSAVAAIPRAVSTVSPGSRRRLRYRASGAPSPAPTAASACMGFSYQGSTQLPRRSRQSPLPCAHSRRNMTALRSLRWCFIAAVSFNSDHPGLG